MSPQPFQQCIVPPLLLRCLKSCRRRCRSMLRQCVCIRRHSYLACSPRACDMITHCSIYAETAQEIRRRRDHCFFTPGPEPRPCTQASFPGACRGGFTDAMPAKKPKQPDERGATWSWHKKAQARLAPPSEPLADEVEQAALLTDHAARRKSRVDNIASGFEPQRHTVYVCGRPVQARVLSLCFVFMATPLGRAIRHQLRLLYILAKKCCGCRYSLPPGR